MYYWDTAALVKLQVRESDSEAFHTLVHQERSRAVSSITFTELLCVLLRKERDGMIASGSAASLLREFQADCQGRRFTVVPYDEPVIREAERLAKLAYGRSEPVLIRSLDLIHVASAALVKVTTVVTPDKRFRDLAVAAGMQVQP